MPHCEHVCENMTRTAVEATSEFVVKEGECARSSERSNVTKFTKFTRNSTLCMFSTVERVCGMMSEGGGGSVWVFLCSVFSNNIIELDSPPVCKCF